MADVYTLGNVGGYVCDCLWDYSIDNGGAVFNTVNGSIVINESIENYKSILFISSIFASPKFYIMTKQVPVELIKNNYSTCAIFLSELNNINAYYSLHCEFTDDKTLKILNKMQGTDWNSLTYGITHIYGMK